MAGIGDQLVPFIAMDADCERIGVVAGMRNQGQDLAIARIHRDHGAVVFAQGDLGCLLQVEIDGEFQIMARLGVLGSENAHLAAVAVDDHVARAVVAAQDLIVGLFHARLSDHVPGLVVGIARLVQVVFADFADISDQVGREPVAGIEAALLVDGLQLRKLVAVGLDKRLLVGGDVLLDGDGLVAGRDAEVAQRSPQLFQIEVQPLRNHGQVGVHILVLLPNQEAGDGRIVVDHQPVLAVKQLAAGGQDGHLADAVLLGEFAEVAGSQHLETPKARAQCQHHHQNAVLHHCGFHRGELFTAIP